ncbi:metallophosphoesterase (plasmid) [Streptomyces sp. BI20]|uniref:metallophosphoesterase n=1 Tax=Streptomyces sp. BI20 TaxID=3403460 RepID=UPI003C71285D
MPVVIAHLSDIHLDGSPAALARTRAVMEYLEGLSVDLDAVLVSGDLADHGTPAEYGQARAALTSRHPVVALPGNHDERRALRVHLRAEAASLAPVDQVLRGNGFVLVALDSSVPGAHHGLLAPGSLELLDRTLSGTSRDIPVLVAFHHPPVPLHTPYVDGIRLTEVEGLAEVADRHPHLLAFLVGHAHTAAATTFAGRPVLVAPGVASTIRLPWEPARDPDHHLHEHLPPAVAFHVVDEDGRLTTHFRPVPLPPPGPGSATGRE